MNDDSYDHGFRAGVAYERDAWERRGAQRSAVQEALDLAVNMIMANEPGHSCAVSNEAVALAAVSCGDTSDGVMAVIRAALSDASGVQK